MRMMSWTNGEAWEFGFEAGLTLMLGEDCLIEPFIHIRTYQTVYA